MSCLYYLLILSAFVICGVFSNAKLQLNITTASKKFNVKIKYAGADDKFISDKEISMFNITDDNLKRGFRVELGKRPDDVFLNDPTPFGNTFKKFKWKESKRTIRIKSVEVLDVINENFTLKIHDYINNTSEDIMTNASVFDRVENTIASRWSIDGVPDDNILVNLTITFGTKKFLVVNKWRQKNYNAFSLFFGRNFGNVNNVSGKTATAILTATKSILIIKVTYSAQLTGLIVGNYEKHYGKYHFWAPTIANIMKAAKLKNEVLTTQFLEVRCYTDPELKVYDKVTGKMLFSEQPKKIIFT